VTDRQEPSEVPPLPEDWVPVEHRVLGIDKRTIAPSLAVLALVVFMAVILPWINDSVAYDDPIVAGDVIDLAGGKLTFVPAEGWNRTKGLLVAEQATASVGSVSRVVLEDASVTMTTGKFDGTPDELLDQINKLNEDLQDPRGLGASGPRQTVTTATGLTGVVETFTGLDQKGVAGAFVVDVDGTSVGVQVVVRGSVETMSDHVDEITRMLDSLELPPGGAKGAGS
jgi:hypothetical protein